MFGVRKSREKKFLNGLKKVFQKLLGRLRGKTPDELERELRMHVPTSEEEKMLRRVVTTMVKSEQQETARTWREAVMKSTRAREMYREIEKEMSGPVGQRVADIAAENVKYIKTLPWAWSEHVVAYVNRETAKGKRPEEIQKELAEIMPEHIQRNLKTIVRTECAKANAAVVEARAENLGIRAYIWRSAKDERTRYAHGKMDGVMVFFNDPPNPEALFPHKGQRPYGSYHAGNTFNCRCYMEPVVNINFLPDSIRVHDHGSIESMTKGQIRKKYGNIS